MDIIQMGQTITLLHPLIKVMPVIQFINNLEKDISSVRFPLTTSG